MDPQIVILTSASLLACALVLKAFVMARQRARSIDAGEVSSTWLTEQRADRNLNSY
jgi:hypothetical protein